MQNVRQNEINKGTHESQGCLSCLIHIGSNQATDELPGAVRQREIDFRLHLSLAESPAHCQGTIAMEQVDISIGKTGVEATEK
jgi:hypothetical protein